MVQALREVGEVEEQRRSRADKGSVRLTGRDVETLAWIGEQYAIRTDQLARLLGRTQGRVLAESTTRAALSRWQRAGLARSKKVTAHQPGFAWLTTRGLREVGLEFKTWEPVASTVAHVVWINQVRLYVEDRHPEFRWACERAMRSGRGPQTMSDAAAHLPDAELHSNDVVVAVEVELTLKSVPRRAAIMGDLASRYATVWYFAPPEVERVLQRTLQDLGADARRRIRIYPLERVA